MTSETLTECKRRLDDLLPEQDAAVFGANNGLKAGTWERAFVEAVAVAYNAVDALAASELRLAEVEKERETNAELLFQAGCVFALNEDNIPAKRMFERAKKLGHKDAEEQLAALAHDKEKHGGPEVCPNWYDYCRCQEIAAHDKEKP